MKLSDLFGGGSQITSSGVHQKKNTSGVSATLVKSGATTLYGYSIQNIDDAGSVNGNYLKIYDKASPPVVGTDTWVAIVYQYTVYVSNIYAPAGGLKLNNGLAYAITSSFQDFGNAFDNVNADQSFCTLFYS